MFNKPFIKVSPFWLVGWLVGWMVGCILLFMCWNVLLKLWKSCWFIGIKKEEEWRNIAIWSLNQPPWAWIRWQSNTNDVVDFNCQMKEMIHMHDNCLPVNYFCFIFSPSYMVRLSFCWIKTSDTLKGLLFNSIHTLNFVRTLNSMKREKKPTATTEDETILQTCNSVNQTKLYQNYYFKWCCAKSFISFFILPVELASPTKKVSWACNRVC